MADLDDFFAKKGKKKKSKSGSKKTSDGTEDRAVVQLVTGTLEEETEWKEVKDTVEISADDLKLQTLSPEEPNNKGTDSHSKSKTQDASKGKEQESSKANLASPWQPLQKEKECTSPATTVTKMPSVSSSSTYVPPSKRKPKKPDPLDFTSESAFPSLVSTAETEKTKKKSKSTTSEDDEDEQQQMYTELHLQNKFSSLRTE